MQHSCENRIYMFGFFFFAWFIFKGVNIIDNEESVTYIYRKSELKREESKLQMHTCGAHKKQNKKINDMIFNLEGKKSYIIF